MRERSTEVGYKNGDECLISETEQAALLAYESQRDCHIPAPLGVHILRLYNILPLKSLKDG